MHQTPEEHGFWNKAAQEITRSSASERGNVEGAEDAEKAIPSELCVHSALGVSIPPVRGVRMFTSGCCEQMWGRGDWFWGCLLV